MMDGIGMHPPRVNAYAAGLTETAGGAAFAVGTATPLAGAALIGTMITAIRKVHGPNGPWITKQGWEYNAVLIAAIAALIEDQYNVAVALGAIGLGAAASAAAIQLAQPPVATESYPADATTADESVGSAGAGDTGTVTPERVRADLRRSA
jgi:putative oxidoreductase